MSSNYYDRNCEVLYGNVISKKSCDIRLYLIVRFQKATSSDYPVQVRDLKTDILSITNKNEIRNLFQCGTTPCNTCTRR